MPAATTTSIITVDASQFGVSCNARSSPTRDRIRITVVTDYRTILVWDLSSDQAAKLASRLARELALHTDPPTSRATSTV